MMAGATPSFKNEFNKANIENALTLSEYQLQSVWAPPRFDCYFLESCTFFKYLDCQVAQASPVSSTILALNVVGQPSSKISFF